MDGPPKDEAQKVTDEDIQKNMDVFNDMVSGKKDKSAPDADKEKRKKQLKETLLETCKNKKIVGSVMRTIDDDPELRYKAEAMGRQMNAKNGVVKINAMTATKEEKKMAKMMQNSREAAKIQVPQENIICVNMLLNGKLSPFDIHSDELQSEKYIMYPVVIGDTPLTAVVKNMMFDGVNLPRNKVAEHLINESARRMEQAEGQIKGPVLFIKLKIEGDEALFEDMGVGEFKEMLNEATARKKA